MSISFQQWRRAKRRRFDADLRALRRGDRRTSPTRWWKRLWPRRSTLIIVGLAGLAVAAAVWTPPRDMVGAASAAVSVVDGDTLRLGSERIRLHGIDAPESQQRCADGWHAGDAARRALAGLVSGRAPRCEKVTTDRYGRTVAICRVDGEDIGAAMVRRGLAWAYTAYSVRYLPEEWLARLEGIGVHGRSCTLPSEWRASRRRRP